MRREKGRFLTRYDKVQKAEPTEVVSNLNGSLYVVIFNAREDRHSHDVRLVYHSLIDVGISNTNISVLEGDGMTKNRFVDKPATIRSLDSVIDSIRQKANSNDRLLVYVTNHGNYVNGQSCVEAHYGTIWEKYFEQMMQDLPVNFGLFYFAQCHAGGFAERMGYGRNIGMSIVNRTELSHGFYKEGNAFTRHLFPKILRERVTIEEAFNYATNKNTALWRRATLFLAPPYTETPQLRWQNADPSQLYLGSTSPSKK